MKKNKLFLTLLIATIFCLTLNVKAISITTDSTQQGTVDTNSYLVTNTGTLTVTNVDDSLLAYKILDTFYNADSNTITYEFTSDFKIFLGQNTTYKNLTVDEYYKLTSGDITSGSTTTTSTLDKLMSSYATYIRNNLAQNGISLNKTNTTASKKLSAGSYLVLKNNSVFSPRLFAVMVGNIEFVAENDTWVLKDATIVAKKTNNAMHLFIANATNKEPTQFLDGNIMSISAFNNDEVELALALTVPIYPTNATNKVYKIQMEINGGMEIPYYQDIGIRNYINESDSVSNKIDSLIYQGDCIYEGDEEVCDSKFYIGIGSVRPILVLDPSDWTAYPVLESSSYIDENLISNNTMNYYLHGKFPLSNLRLGSQGNVLTAIITYSTDPYGTETTTETETIIIYSYGLNATVYELDNESKKLSDITFEVYTDEGLTNKIGTFTTDSDGKIQIKGIADGTYYIKQTRTKAGYKIIDPTSIVISSDTVGDNGYLNVDIQIPKSALLPFTGGVGNIIYTSIGLIVITCSAAIFILYKKGYDKKNQ